MRAFARDTGGAIAVMTALVMPVLIGVAAYAIDASLLLYRQERLQVATDIGAQAGADLLRRGESETAAKAFAEAMVAANAGGGTGPWLRIKAEILEPGQVKVDAELDVERIFSQIFGSDAFVVRASDTVIFEPEDVSVTCLYLDDLKGDPALELLQRSRLIVRGCEVEVASGEDEAVDLHNNRAVLEADCVTVAGTIRNSDAVTSDCPGFRENTAVRSPVPVPTAPHLNIGCSEFDSEADDKKLKEKGKKKLDGDGDDSVELPLGPSLLDGLPQICFSKFEIERDTVGGAGVYFFEDDLKIKDGATLTLGPRAVIVLLDDAAIDMGDDTRLIVTAPKRHELADGSVLADIAIMQGRERDDPGAHKVGMLDIRGQVLLPGEDIEINGQSTSRCTQILAGTLEMAAGAELTIDCSDGD